MGQILPIHVGMDVAYALIEPVVSYAFYGFNTAPGLQTISTSTSWLAKSYVGAQYVIGIGASSQEVIQIASISGGNATFFTNNAHAANDLVCAALFSSGQINFPMWTQSEVLEYIAEAQNDFLLRVQPIITTATKSISVPGGRIYDQPGDCMRIERQSIAGQELLETSQADLDLNDPTWQSETGTPRKWFQDGLNNAQYGFYPSPDGNYTSLLYYSQKGAVSLAWTDAFLVPDVFTYIIKYGVLARCWGKDGEGADPQRSAYCQKRFDFGVFLALKFMSNALMLPQHKQMKGGFKPMQRPQLDQSQDQQPNPLMFGAQ